MRFVGAALCLLINLFFQIPAFADEALNIAPIGGTEPLFDTYFFSGDGQSLRKGQAEINASAGTTLEDRGDLFKLYSGQIYIATKNKAVKIDTGAATFSVPPSSVATVAYQDQFLSTSKSSSGFGSDNGAPIFIVGHSPGLLPTAQSNVVSLSHGRIFFSTDRDINIQTPMGLLKAKANSQFYVTSSENELRVLFCRGKELLYHFGSKYRRIGPSQEFAVFDHRPFQWEVLPIDGLGRKQVTLHDLAKNNVTACSASFSLVTMLKSPQYLGGWGRTSGTDKRLEAAMIKTAAVHAAVGASFEDFYKAPSVLDKTINSNSGGHY